MEKEQNKDVYYSGALSFRLFVFEITKVCAESAFLWHKIRISMQAKVKLGRLNNFQTI